MNTATNDSETMTVSHDGVDGRNGYQNGKAAIQELPILGTGGSPRIPSTSDAAESSGPRVSETPREMWRRGASTRSIFLGTGIPIALA